MSASKTEPVPSIPENKFYCGQRVYITYMSNTVQYSIRKVDYCRIQQKWQYRVQEVGRFNRVTVCKRQEEADLAFPWVCEDFIKPWPHEQGVDDLIGFSEEERDTTGRAI